MPQTLDTLKRSDPRIMSPVVFRYVVKNTDIATATTTGDLNLREVLNAILFPFNR